MSNRVALLTNFLPPYRVPVLKALQGRIGELRVFVSVPMEPNRDWSIEWDTLEVTVQRCITLQRTWRHPHGFSEPNYVHIPYDTLGLLWQYRPQVVISAEMGARTLQSTVYRWLNPKSRLILWATLSESTEQGRGKARQFLRKQLLRLVDAVIVNGESGARYIKHLGRDDERVFRVPQTTHVTSFSVQRSSTMSDNVLRLLSVGHLSELKGILPFVKALSRYALEHPGKDLELWLVGDGPLRASLEAMRYPSNLKVCLWGFVPYDQLPAIYAQSDVFVFPTLADEWGLVVNEAKARATPCNCFTYNGREYCFSSGVIGMMSSAENPEQLEAFCKVGKTYEVKPGIKQRFESFAGAAEEAHKKIENIPKGERLVPWLTAMGEELEKRSIEV